MFSTIYIRFVSRYLLLHFISGRCFLPLLAFGIKCIVCGSARSSPVVVKEQDREAILPYRPYDFYR